MKDRILLVTFILFNLFLFILSSCDKSSNYIFYINKESNPKQEQNEIKKGLMSKNISLKRDTIIRVSEEKIYSAKEYLEELILSDNELLKDRILAAKSYADLFGIQSVELVNNLSLYYNNDNITVAVELVYSLLSSSRRMILDIELLKERFGDLFLFHYNHTSAFSIKSKTLLLLSLMYVEQIIPIIKDNLTLDNPIICDTAIAMANLIIYQHIHDVDKESLLNKDKTKSIIINLIKNTNEDQLRRKLRYALYKINKIEVNLDNGGDEQNDETMTSIINLKLEEHSMIERLNTISDLGSRFLRISLGAEYEIKSNIEEYMNLLLYIIDDTEDMVVYKVSSILSEYDLSSNCSLINDSLTRLANGDIINPDDTLYIPTLINMIRLSGKSQCNETLPILKSLIDHESVAFETLLSLTNFDDNLLQENDINLDNLLKSKYIKFYFEYLYSNKKHTKLINLIKTNNGSELFGVILYIRTSLIENKIEKLNKRLEELNDKHVNKLINKYLLNR